MIFRFVAAAPQVAATVPLLCVVVGDVECAFANARRRSLEAPLGAVRVRPIVHQGSSEEGFLRRGGHPKAIPNPKSIGGQNGQNDQGKRHLDLHHGDWVGRTGFFGAVSKMPGSSLRVNIT